VSSNSGGGGGTVTPKITKESVNLPLVRQGEPAGLLMDLGGKLLGEGANCKVY
jgi:hypothetical protein